MLYDEFALELPPVTEAFLSIVNWAPWTLCGVLALLVSVTSLPRLFGTGFAIRNALPIFGKLYVSLSHEEFSRTLASFVKLRMPLNDALEYTASLMQDQSLAAAARRLASQVATGTPLSTAMHKSRHFERSLAVIANWGEAGSSLDDSLELAADMYAERRRQRLHLLRRIVPPFTLVAVASMALATVVPIMLPLISLVESLS
jgi:type II secretory pathway component PulF